MQICSKEFVSKLSKPKMSSMPMKGASLGGAPAAPAGERLVPGVEALGEAAALSPPEAPQSRSVLMRLTTASNMRP